MSTSFKIRLLLFLLALSFIITAVTVDLTFHKNDLLFADARKIERRLHEKELFAKAFLNNPSTFRSLETIDNNEVLASKIIPDLSSRSIYLYTYRNNQLVFWGDNRLILENAAGLKEGSNMIKWQNGWYEGIKHSTGNFSAVCIILIKPDYPYENKYLKNAFIPDLIRSNNLEIASLDDDQAYSIRNADGKYLFLVKLKSSITNIYYQEIILWILAILFGCIFMNAVCVWIASKKNHIKTAVFLFFLFFLVLRILEMETNWFYAHFNLQIFKPRDNATFFFSSIGSFFLNMVACLWLLAFTYSYRFKIRISDGTFSKNKDYIIFIILGLVVSLGAFQVNSIVYDLMANTTINIDMTNVLNLDWLSWLGILILCISILNLYLLLEISIIVGGGLNLTNRERLIIFLTGVGVIFLIKLFLKDPDISFLLFALIIFLMGWKGYKNNNVFNLGVFVSIILIFSIIASVKLSNFQSDREHEQRKVIAKKLESGNDLSAVLLFSDLEQKILKDDFIINFFRRQNKDSRLLNNYLQKYYFNGYLSRYNFTLFNYELQNDSEDKAFRKIEEYKILVLSGSSKVSEYFYKNNNTFGMQNYFSLMPVKLDDEIIGTFVIELKSKTLQDPYSFPPLLLDNKTRPANELAKYSFAYYKDGHLVNQYGDYVYSLINKDFKGKVNNFVFIEKNDFSHVIYHLKERRLIVVSRPLTSWIMYLASVSFMFLVLLIFITTVISVYWIWNTVNDKNIRLNNFSWNYILSKNHILYKTRIQASMLAAIVFTLVIIGNITYFSISYQYRKQQQDIVLKRVNQIDEGIEKQMFQGGVLRYNEELLNTFTSINATELNLYSPGGNLLFTTQPQIYNNGLLTDKMNALAYIYLNKYQRSEYINKEDIGGMRFNSAYKPIRNNRNETVAYLNVPDFSNENDFEERIGQFLNTLINVYALVFVVIGFFAVFVANKITYPLTLVQKSLSETKIGRKNEPILWERDDEIGNLIKEYNKMIVALEDSTQKFARSERETAWKEMAKQVAHEIKNPLTPLKLGVQLLEKSWKENDPNFNAKFEKFSKSFIEQIESLSHIASEFSNFAKMPDTILENVNLREIIEQSIEVFQPIEQVNITLYDHTKSNLIIKGDKDQLLRSFNNLIKNAVESIPDSQEGNIEIILEEKDKHILVQIIDNGKGIPEGLRERIFTPHFTTKTSGTGLGLAFVKQAIENMLGTIRFETELNKGTKFYITMPFTTV